jgi:hypothetical protein
MKSSETFLIGLSSARSAAATTGPVGMRASSTALLPASMNAFVTVPWV